MKSNQITTPHTYSLMLKAVADTEGCDSAFCMFNNLEGENCDVVVYNTVISICGRTNDWCEAEKVWRTMKERECLGSEVTYSLLVSIFGRCGKHELALDAYNEMHRNGLTPRGETTEVVIVLYAKEGKWDLALKHFDEMLNDGSSTPSLDTCHALMKSLGLAGKVKRAIWVFECLEMFGHEPNAYTWNALLKALYRGNRHGDVIRLFEALLERKERSLLNEELYKTALMSCRKLGLWEKAVQVLWQMETSSERLVSSVFYSLVIGACEKAGNADVGLRVYERMVQQKCSLDRYT
ncbi:Pentatricopeptide repeat-containing protein At3g29290 [Linum grandiflorum]